MEGTVSMTALSSPIDYLKKSAKTLNKLVDEGDLSAIDRARAVFSDLTEKTNAEVTSAFGLMRAQHVVAVEHGFSKWNDLIEHSPISLRLAITMAKEPFLTDFGIGLHENHRTLPKNERDAIFGKQRDALGKSGEAIGKTVDWLQKYIQPIKTINTKHSSYNLKHIAEKDIGYITNGVFIAAAIIADYPYKIEDGSPNPYFGMSEKSVKEAKRMDRNSRQDSKKPSVRGTKPRRSTITVEEGAALVPGAKIVSVPDSWLDNLPIGSSVWDSLYAWLEKEHGAVEDGRLGLHNRTFVGGELMSRLRAAEIKRIRRLKPTVAKTQVERTASFSDGDSGPHELFVDDKKIAGDKLFFVPKDVDVWSSDYQLNLEDPIKQANEAWRTLISHLKDLGWRVVTLANRQAYYKDNHDRHGTLSLAEYGNGVWRWFIDHYTMRKRNSYELIRPQLPLTTSGDSGSTELTCAPVELATLAEWLPDWFVAYRAGRPLPSPPIHVEGSSSMLHPWKSGYGWTKRAQEVNSASRV